MKLLGLLLALPVSLAMTDHIEFTAGETYKANATSTNSSLSRRDAIHWGEDDTHQEACDAKSFAQPAGGSEFLKADCQDIINNNIFPGRWTVSGYTNGRWAKINIRGTCLLSVKREDGSTNPFE